MIAAIEEPQEIHIEDPSHVKLQLKCRASDSRFSTNTSNLDSRYCNQSRERIAKSQCSTANCSSSSISPVRSSWTSSVVETESRTSSALSDLPTGFTISSQSDPKMSKQAFAKSGSNMTFNQGNASGVASNIKNWFFHAQAGSGTFSSVGGSSYQNQSGNSNKGSAAFGRNGTSSDLRGMNTWMPTSM